MLPQYTAHQLYQPSPLLPDDLKDLLTSRTRHNSLGMIVIDTDLLINGRENELISKWLTEEEHQQLTRYSFEKRRQEWFLGRICAKQATLELLNGRNGVKALQPLDLSIGVNPGGRPYVQVARSNAVPGHLDISISHSHQKVAGLACRDHCGVDIQYLSDTLFKVKDRYCNGTEAALLDSTAEDELIQLGLLWVAKEALRKCLNSDGHPGFLAMQLDSIRPERDYRKLDFTLDKPYSHLGTVSVITHVHGDYALAVCTLAADKLDA